MTKRICDFIAKNMGLIVLAIGVLGCFPHPARQHRHDMDKSAVGSGDVRHGTDAEPYRLQDCVQPT